jgi:hypothetical protein
MKTMLDNFINGNLKTAKKQAGRFGFTAIADSLREDYGFSNTKALTTAAYLKGLASFQDACDAV